MHVRRYATAAEILRDVQSFLERDEAVANLPLGVLARLARSPAPTDEDKRPFFALVAHERQPVLLMMRTPPHNMILHSSVDGREPGAHLDKAIEIGVRFLIDEDIGLPGVIGPRDVATQFAGAWGQETGGRWRIEMEQMIYRLDRVNEVPLTPGRLIQAQAAHLDLATDWILAFSGVTPESWTQEEARERAQEQIAAESLYLWQDGRPVSMAWRTRPTRHSITVSGVYTPPEHRRRGYATSCVAALSRLLLAEGHQFCALYTDLANPTSNSIYQKIGYRPICASAMIEFIP